MNFLAAIPSFISKTTCAVPVCTVLGLAALASPASADLLPVSVTSSDIQITVQTSADSSTITYTLGSFTATLQNSSYTNSSGGTTDACIMRSIFTVNTGSNAAPSSLFDHIQLHWYQDVDSLSIYDSIRYKGSPVYNHAYRHLPITDPPSGGWDYMYSDGSSRTTVGSGWSLFVDDVPYYYTRNGELTVKASTGSYFSQPGIQYIIEDQPTDRASVVTWSTYLVAEVTDDNAFDQYGILPGQMLVLGGFTWHNSSSDLNIDDYYTSLTTTDISNINSALNYAGFSAWNAANYTGWMAVADKTIEIPEPASLSLLLLGSLALLKRPNHAAITRT